MGAAAPAEPLSGKYRGKCLSSASRDKDTERVGDDRGKLGIETENPKPVDSWNDDGHDDDDDDDDNDDDDESNIKW